MRRGRRMLTVALLLTAFAASGCSSVVFEPENPHDPVAVYVLSEGIHTGLIMPQEPDGFVEYGYGEWAWYAEEKTGLFDSVSAALWETQGTLGRRIIPVEHHSEPTGEDLIAWLKKRGYRVRLSPVWVPRERMRALRQKLAATYEAAKEKGPAHDAHGFTFVHDPHGYWLGCNCADVTADWLRELGCEVTPALFRTSLSVAGQPRDLTTDDK